MSLKRIEFVNLREAGSDALTAAARLAAYHQGQGRRVLIEAIDQAEAQEMDKRLWTFKDGSFVPHFVAGGPDQAQEPVLIDTQAENPNGAEVLIRLHPKDPTACDGFSVAILLIPAENGPELDTCRDLYAKMREAGQAEVVHITGLP